MRLCAKVNSNYSTFSQQSYLRVIRVKVLELRIPKENPRFELPIV